MIKLVKIKTKSGKRVGRGYGSGKGGHTSGRGQKGQKTREMPHILFEGVKMKKSQIKRLPFLRGAGKFKAKKKGRIVNLGKLNLFSAGEKVTRESLEKLGVISSSKKRTDSVKILGKGNLTKKLTVELPTSKNASRKLQKGDKQVSDKS